MDFRTLRLDLDAEARLATITLDRPDRLNALSAALLQEVIDVSHHLDTLDDITVVLVRGAGRAFSAGFDLHEFGSVPAGGSARDVADLGRRAADALTNVRALTVAAIHGHCVGGGLVLAASCDLRIAATSARFSIPEVDLGIPLAWGGIPRLVRELGPAVTKELVLTCRPFDAQEALAFRFLNRVVADDELESRSAELARSLAAKPAFALRSTKSQVNAVAEEMAGTGRSANDADTLTVALHDPESRAASAAYLQRRR